MAIDLPDALTPPRPRGQAVIAWVVILLVVAGLFVLPFFRASNEGRQLDVFELQTRAIVGAGALGGADRDDLYKEVKGLDRGLASQRLRFVVLAGELKGPDEALARLDDLKEQLDQGAIAHTTPDEGRQAEETGAILGRLYRDFKNGDLSAPHVNEEDRRTLQQRLGWFGDLALNPRDGPNPAARAAVLAPAERSAMAGVAVMLVVFGAGMVGFMLLVLFLALWRRMHSRITTGSPYGGVYAETFALWLIVYVGLSLAAAFLPAGLPPAVVFGLPQVLSLGVLAWPVLRGVPWRQVRHDIGWFAGDRPMLEPFFGLLCYLAALPVVLLAALAILAVVQILQKAGLGDLLGPNGTPTHPVVFEVLHGSWPQWLQILFVASVLAPLLEETMFRGVLYRHLREATGGRGWLVSVALSALLASFVFAALHPQGWLGIPVLMALALGFTAAREWRGSLVPSMTVHALNNTLVLLLLILTAG